MIGYYSGFGFAILNYNLVTTVNSKILNTLEGKINSLLPPPPIKTDIFKTVLKLETRVYLFFHLGRAVCPISRRKKKFHTTTYLTAT